MAKRKRTQNPPQQRAHDAFDPKASKLSIKSYQDVGDSEDEFLAHRDQIFLDNGPDAKRRKQREDDDLEMSDEEILPIEDDDEDEEEEDFSEDDDEEEIGSMRRDDDYVSDGSKDESGEEEDDDDIGGWGSKRADYYNADAIETEQDAIDEEIEARRIQQRQRKALREADFGFDEDSWANEEGDEGDGIVMEVGGTVTETLPQLQIREDMSVAERLKLLKTRYPEFEPLARELARLQPVYDGLKEKVESHRDAELPNGHGQESATTWQFRVLSGYMGALAMYFALLTSTANTDSTTSNLPMPAIDLREHEVISSLEQYQRLWTTVEMMQDESDQEDGSESLDGDLNEFAEDEMLLSSDEEVGDEDDYDMDSAEDEAKQTSNKSSTMANAAMAASQARRAARLRETEEGLKGLDEIQKRTATTHPTFLSSTRGPQDDSDFGDEQPLLPDEAAEKARKRKSLRFYTSQIAQKANKRANASRAVGGDDDIPRRERLRDRQERLNKEAEKRGSKSSKGDIGEDLNGDADDLDQTTNQDREELELDEGDKAFVARVRAKKEAKILRDEAYRQAKEEGGRVVIQSAHQVGPDGRRNIGYAIEKNKGLIPKRKKEVKNPRVKKRKKFEEKSKKLRSMKPMYKGGEGRGGYGGEMTGIKKNLVRSTKL